MLSKNQIKEIQSLHLKKYRDKEKIFVAEGIKVSNEILKLRPSLIKKIFCTESYLQNNKNLLNQFSTIVIVVTNDELKKISLQENPNEILILASYFESKPQAINFNSDFSLYLDDIRDPGNLGTMLRLADWFGIHQIFASPNTCDIYNPKVIQASMGAFLRVNVAYAQLHEVINEFKIKNVYGALLNGESIYTKKIETGLIVIGNEANGISSENLNLINQAITIPSSPLNGTESLNAAIATSIIVSEFYKAIKI